jgi:hypothetical protein
MKDGVGCQEDMVPGWSIGEMEYWSIGDNGTEIRKSHPDTPDFFTASASFRDGLL